MRKFRRIKKGGFWNDSPAFDIGYEFETDFIDCDSAWDNSAKGWHGLANLVEIFDNEPVKEITNMNEYDVSVEEFREYVYGDGSAYRVDKPVKLYVKSDEKGDSHRVVDIKNVTHYPKRGWIAIRWYAPSQNVSF